MVTGKAIEFACFLIAGILVILGNKPTKVDYGLVWIALLIHIVSEIVSK